MSEDANTTEATATGTTTSPASAAPQSRRRTRADLLLRRARVAELLERGAAAPAIVRQVAREFGITERSARTDVARLRDRWADAIAAEEPHRRSRLLAFLDSVAEGAHRDRAWNAAVGAARAIASICGLDTPARAVAVEAAPETSLLASLRTRDERGHAIAALRLSNAERMARIDSLTAEGVSLDDEPAPGTATAAPAVEQARLDTTDNEEGSDHAQAHIFRDVDLDDVDLDDFEA
jgi:hypothetical protein